MQHVNNEVENDEAVSNEERESAEYLASESGPSWRMAGQKVRLGQARWIP